jgi:hypothetical protein
MLEERVKKLEKIDKEIKYNQVLAKRVVELLRKERDEKEEASKKKEASRYKDMVA